MVETHDLAGLLRSWKLPAPDEIEPETVSSSARIPLATSYSHEGGEDPGSYPFTRGRTARGYRDGLWVMGQYSGFATPAETRARFVELIDAGQTGLSIALDLPTQMGHDSDAPIAAGEVGRVGVPVDTVDDLIDLFDGVPLDRVRQIRTTANAIGPVFVAMFVIALEELGVDPGGFRMMLQNDPLKEYSARGTFIFPPRAGVKLAVDVVEHLARELPHWEPIEFCGYHIRDAGGTAVHEVAIMTANGLEYLDEAVRRGVDLAGLAPALHLFLSAGMDVFEEAAKLRMARRLWARILHEQYGVPKSSAAVKLFVYTLGGALQGREPLNNVVRVTCEALGAVLGGADTLATSSFDEALGLPTPQAAQLALRTQQILALEAGAAKVVDPLGGSHYVEELTDGLETQVLEMAASILERGGAVEALESGYIEELLSESAYEHQRDIESGVLPIVGVNVYEAAPTAPVQVFRIADRFTDDQKARTAEIKQQRDDRAVAVALMEVTRAAGSDENVIPAVTDAVRVRATLGEVVDSLAAVFGRYAPNRLRLGG